MHPIRSTHLTLRFASDFSPWWLLLLLPCVWLVAVWLLRRQFPDVQRSRSLGLSSLRLLLLAAVALLAFRPDIVLTETLTWLGRVIVLVDNSASMAVNDPSLPADEALLIARSLDASLEPRAEHDMAGKLLASIAVIDRFEPMSRDASRESDSFWKMAEAAEKAMSKPLEEAGVEDLIAEASPLFSGQRHPGSRAFDVVRQRLTEAALDLRRRRAKADVELLASDATAAGGLTVALADIRARTRIDIVRAMLKQSPTLLPEQFLEIRPLTGIGDPFAIGDGGTDIGGGLAGIFADSTEPSAGASASLSPVNGIVLVSDGRDTACPVRPAANVLSLLAQRKTPVLACVVGGTAEPTDVAVLDVGMPPIGVADVPLNVTVRVKVAASDSHSHVQVQLRGRDNQPAVLAEANVEPSSTLIQTVAMAFTPHTLDTPTLDDQPVRMWPLRMQRITIDAGTLPDEVVPTVNNQRDAVVAVVPEKLRVLLLDAVPRWETRFAINILRRLPFADVNAIVASTRPDGRLERDVRRGTWPADDATLSLYCVVILGDLPADTLTQGERNSLDRWVNHQGGTLVQLAAGVPIAVPAQEWQIRRTAVGCAHPLTRRVVAPLLESIDAPATAGSASSGASKDVVTPLLVALDPAGGPPVPLVSVSRDGRGKRATIATDQLWRVLNPRDLDAHTALYAELVTWAATAAEAKSCPQADTFVATDQEPISAVLPADSPADAVVEVVVDDAVVATAISRDGAAVLPAQKPGQVRLRLAGQQAMSEPIDIVADDPERTILARNDAWLATLATRTGGSLSSIADLPQLVGSVPPRSHVEHRETVWRPWNSGWTIVLLAGLLIVEWIWRKWEGLV
ncbi:MAG: hypothetical protein NTY25_02685 [Planctomycetia bacterium]|nr:hypothetical protein [Planctomycetia bacterium]